MTTSTLFNQAAPTGVNGTSSTAGQVLGVIFQVSTGAALNGIWFYSPSGAGGLPAAVAVFLVSTQASVVTDSSPSWSGAAGSGWVYCDLSAFSITLSASTQYCAAVWSSGSLSGVWDEYSTTWWQTGVGPGSGGVTSGILSAPDSSGGNVGLLLNGAGSITYPTSSFSDSNYWVDVQVTSSSPPSSIVGGLQVPALFDTFKSPSTLSSRWGGSSGASISGGTATVAYAANGSATLKSGSAYDFTGSWHQVQASPQIRASTKTGLQVGPNSSNYFDIHYDGTNLVGTYDAAGSVTTVGTVTYNATNHAWWRIREVGGSVYWDVSANGITWTNLWSTTYSIVITSCLIQGYAQDNGSGLSGSSAFLNFNTNAVAPSPISLVNTTVGSMYTAGGTLAQCGPRTVAPGNTQGNLLVVFAAWNNNSLFVPTPAAAVADSQGNWWRYVGDSGTPGSTTLRCGIFICSNAMAVQNWLSFCPQGYTGSFMFQVDELTGVPASYWPLLDFHVATAAIIGSTSISLTGITQNHDYVLTMAATQYNTMTLTGIGNGFTEIAAEQTSGSGGLADVSIGIATAIGSFAAETPTVAAWTVGGTNIAETVAVSVGITIASSLPAQSRSVFPRVVVEQAFGANPGDSTAAVLDDAWTNMGTYALGKQGQMAISSTRGQQYELAQPEAGQMTVAMNNQAGDFNPQWSGSEFYSNAINSNMSFQLGVAPWTAIDNAQVAQSSLSSFASAAGAQATYSALVTPDGVTANPGIQSEPQPVNTNYKYSASAWVNVPAGWGGGIQVSIVWLDVSGATISSSAASTSAVAGTYVQATVLGATPPSNAATARVAVQLLGTPASSVTFFVAEGAIVPGSLAVQTGLVRLGVPTRVSCFWQGRRYPVGFGYVERWPQDWPDFPQWGWSNLIATDVVGVAASVNLPSAVQGEILADDPWVCLPFNEQYTAPDATIPFSGVDGMFAGNTSYQNTRSGIYTNGQFTPVVTGQTSGVLGDSGTGMGNAADTAPSTTNFYPGPGVLYGPDYNLPGVPCSFEFWVAVPNLSAVLTAAKNVKLFSLIFPPNLTSKSLGYGGLVTVGVQFNTTDIIPRLWVATNSTALTLVGELESNNYLINGTVFSVDSSLVHIEVSAQHPTATVSVSINGGTPVTVAYTPTPGSPIAIGFGEATHVTGLNYYTYQYAMSYGTMFQSSLPAWRQVAHAQSGLSGFGQDGLTDRALRYVAWAGLNLGLAGPQDTFSELGPAYSTAGSSLATALNGDAQSFAARWAGIANGNLVIQTRQAQFNQTSQVTFGDNPTGPLNTNPAFQQGLTGWSASGCTPSIVASTRFTFSQSCLLTFNGTTANPRLYANSGGNISVNQNEGYDLVTWLMSPTGWYGGAGIAIDWYNGATYLSTTSGTAVLPPGVWTPVNPIGPAPAIATQGVMYVFAKDTPPASTQIFIDQAVMRVQNDQVTYMPLQAMDYDNTYVNNSVKASVTEGTITTATPTVVSRSSMLQYFQRGPLQQAVSGTTAGDAYDRANWSINKYQQPSMRVRAIQVASHSRPATFNQVLQTDLGDPAVTLRSPLGQTRYDLPVVTQRVETHIGPGVWTTDYQQSPYVPEGTVLQTDVTAREAIGSNALGW